MNTLLDNLIVSLNNMIRSFDPPAKLLRCKQESSEQSEHHNGSQTRLPVPEARISGLSDRGSLRPMTEEDVGHWNMTGKKVDLLANRIVENIDSSCARQLREICDVLSGSVRMVDRLHKQNESLIRKSVEMINGAREFEETRSLHAVRPSGRPQKAWAQPDLK